MNLENLNLVELNAREVQETEGGAMPYSGGTWFGFGALASALYDAASGLMDGIEAGLGGEQPC